MFSNELVKTFIGRCQHRLDQEADPTSNFWSTAEMVEYMNEGLREVWQAVRETHQNWFVRTLTSTDGTLRIGGRDYDTDLLRFTNRRTRLLLPPDFRELLFLEGLPPENSSQIGDNFFPVIRFEYRNITQRRHREDSLNFVTTNVRVYLYDIVFSADGPHIELSPPLSLNEDIRGRIKYLAAPPTLRLINTFESTGFTLEMTDAVLAYVCYAAATKEKLVENLTTFKLVWDLKRELAVRSAGPKQTRDEETVEGFLEDEL